MTEQAAPSPLRAGTRLERVLRAGLLAVTAELNPPDTADPQAVYDAALVLSEVADAINCTDASGANVHMSSLGMAALLVRAGYEPVYQMSCRDRNRIALQGDLLGAAALGIGNVLCLTGDDVTAGDQPQARRVFDLDSLQLLQTIRSMRDGGQFLSGRKLARPPRVFLGAAENPFAPPIEWRALRLAKKADAGARFIQTQYIFDVPVFTRFMAQVRDLGLDQRLYILAGVGPLRSPRAAEYMRTHVPGVVIPEEVIDRLNKTPKARWLEQGMQICVENIAQVRALPGVAGFHVMAYRQEEMVAEIIRRAGLFPRVSAAALGSKPAPGRKPIAGSSRAQSVDPG
ncbi:MAG: methylenetetrahydrofolate reductase [Anaerolineales bacterium]|nr:methylenetetrahydrofolate reductase [Anaerolineales bacterium]